MTSAAIGVGALTRATDAVMMCLGDMVLLEPGEVRGDPPRVARQGVRMRWSAVVLAAGLSSRMGERHKMMLPIGDKPVIRHTVERILGAGPHEVVVVTGYKGRDVMKALADLPVTIQPNARYEEGQMTSAAIGVGALARATDAVMTCLGDMVLLESADYAALVSTYVDATDRSIVIPYFGDARGNPILFASSYVHEVAMGERLESLIDGGLGVAGHRQQFLFQRV